MPAVAGCARLRTVESRKRKRPAKSCYRVFCALRRHAGRKKALRPRETRKARKAQFLTSVATMPVLLADFSELLSPIPKVVSTARARLVNAIINGFRLPIDSKALLSRAMPAAGVLGCDSGQLSLYKVHFKKRSRSPTPPCPVMKTEQDGKTRTSHHSASFPGLQVQGHSQRIWPAH